MANHNNKVLTWTASEYIDHQRGPGWYLALAAATILIAAIVFVWSKDYFAVGTIFVVSFIVASVAHWKPSQIEYELSSKGIKIGDKLYPFSLFKTFSVVRETDLLSLVFIPIKRLMPPVSVFLDEINEDKAVSIIGEHLPMEDRVLDGVERLSRRLKF